MQCDPRPITAQILQVDSREPSAERWKRPAGRRDSGLYEGGEVREGGGRGDGEEV